MHDLFSIQMQMIIGKYGDDDDNMVMADGVFPGCMLPSSRIHKSFALSTESYRDSRQFETHKTRRLLILNGVGGFIAW